MFDSQSVLNHFAIGEVASGGYVAGQGWLPTEGREAFDAICPADARVVAKVAGATAEDYDAIIAKAVETQKSWRMVPAPRRGELVHRIGQLMEENIEQLAGVIALDTGKTLPECRFELKEAIDMAYLATGLSRQLSGGTQQSQRDRHRMYEQWLPLGVVGVISAYNFPAAVWAQNAFLSAICGNTVIWKPSPKVPLTAIACQRLAVQAMQEFGADGVFALFIPGDDRIAEKLVADTRVNLISFTGSTGVGHKVASIVSSTLGRRYQLECSGNSAIIVDETADLKQAARAIANSGAGTTGQRCTSARRAIVHKSIEAELIELLKKTYAQIRIGHFTEPGVIAGPLIDKAAIDHYHAAIADAVALGGKVEFGGKRMDRDGYYVEPTFISGCQPDWPCIQRETFAPVVYLLTYETIEEAIAINNGVAQGLAAGIQSTSLYNIELFLSADGNDCGIAKVNMGTTGADVGASFGGEKETGGGRTAGSDAWKMFMRRQSVCINWSGTTPWDKQIVL
ncbi:aldehyde dehydrogenase family protein [Pseudomonas schmalbachii]|uniref:aldehyde dehydrogenase (NAD(+)) n=1 Tax=Pseudomonas schmalbachii TaxID=2816993 RepID=A0ABS3TTD9_9PSED|nr:aldehyde dehydrogenase family protein [Pseudomonas schmalbachii]MBO3276947.1 aldehyde dehydrogenase family protein [Pseudomonas schmalbachii]